MHAHIIPRSKADFENEDDIYRKLEEFDQDYLQKLAAVDQKEFKKSGDAEKLKEEINKILMEQREASGLMME